MMNGSNLSFVWKQAEAMSVGEQARVVLSQPVAILSLTLCALSLVANCLSIIATLLGPNKLATHLKLVISLCISDLLLSISTLSHLLNRIFNPVPRLTSSPEDRLGFSCASTVHFALMTMAIVISLLNLQVMALDHYMAVMSPLHYPTRLSPSKGTIIICCIWFIAFVGGCSVFFADVSQFRKVSHHLNYCEYVQYSDYQGEYLVFFVAFFSFFVISYAYCRIYIEVRRTTIQGLSNRPDFARNRKALLTTLLIIGTFAICWLPTCFFQVVLLILVRVDKAIVQRMYATFLRTNRYLNALLLLNSICDPVIYAFRLREVQLGYRKLSQKCFLYHRRQKRGNSSRSSVMHQTQTVHWHAMENASLKSILDQGGTSNNGAVNYEPPGQQNTDPATEVTPMIRLSSTASAAGDKDGSYHHQHEPGLKNSASS